MNTEFCKMIRTIVKEEAEFDVKEFDRQTNKLKHSLRGCNEKDRMEKIREMILKRDVNNIQHKPEVKVSCINIPENKDHKKRKTTKVDNSPSPVSGVFNEASSPIPKKKQKKFDYSTAKSLPSSVLDKINQLGGDGVILIIQKTLCLTDLSNHHRRVSLPKSQMKPGSTTFLNPVERDFLDSDGDENGRPKLIVGFIEPSGSMDEITLGTWNMGENRMYNLMHTWNNVVAANKLKVGTSIQLWAFRVQSKLWFALVIV
ncbi:B3 domain-containing protein At1g05930-like [Impatiens glandulifera]|uniref:B3 domain-containing protein At1g05930-like n=1 Tax=Impatiens glandulifera TaxID=253017 RepID=UPI001FB19284|nr:B3 domain-containing protein At1g05930-like [Impatiens glandulifera]